MSKRFTSWRMRSFWRVDGHSGDALLDSDPGADGGLGDPLKDCPTCQ